MAIMDEDLRNSSLFEAWFAGAKCDWTKPTCAAAIEHNWKSFPPEAKAFLLSCRCIRSFRVERLVRLWMEPGLIHFLDTESKIFELLDKSHELARQYSELGHRHAAFALALNEAFCRQCIVTPIRELAHWDAEMITPQNLHVLFRAMQKLLNANGEVDEYINRTEVYEYLLHHGSRTKHSKINPDCSPMGWANIVNDNWNVPEKKQADLNTGEQEVEITIVLSHSDDKLSKEKYVMPSTSLRSLLQDYAEECSLSLRSLRFSRNDSTLFLSSLGQKTMSELGMRNMDVIAVCSKNSLELHVEPKQEVTAPEIKQQSKRPKKRSGKKQQKKKKANKPSHHIYVAASEESPREAHSIVLSKIFEEAEPAFKVIRQKLNNLSLDRKIPKAKSPENKKTSDLQSTEVFNTNTDMFGGKAGKTSYAINIGQVENLYISSKRNSKHSHSPATIDLHGCHRHEAVERLNAALGDWIDVAMKGEYPWVQPAVIVCGGGNQILSETVEAWIKENKNVANAPKGNMLRW